MSRRVAPLVLVLGALTVATGCGDDDEGGTFAGQKARTIQTKSTDSATDAERTDAGEKAKVVPSSKSEDKGKGKSRGGAAERERVQAPKLKPGPNLLKKPRDQSQVRKLQACLRRQQARIPASEDYGPGPFARCLNVSRKELRAAFLRGCRALARRNKDRSALRRCPAEARRFFSRRPVSR